MVLPVVKYGDPVLRKKGAPIESITPEVRRLIADMFDTMYAAHGVGLAAQQVGHALQLTVIDVRDVKDRPSQVWIDGEERDPATIMPLALLNPQLQLVGTPSVGPEGCLSFPDIYADVKRAPEVEVTGIDGEGRPVRFKAGGLLARAVQHETDHLHGILFIDRMDSETRAEIKPDVDDLLARTRKALARG